MQKDYEDIINLPHHVSRTRPQMDIYNRAAQFSPFAALTGYETAIDETVLKHVNEIERKREQKMKIMVSACLMGENCKYNGGNNYKQKVIDYVQGHEVIAVCPEVMGGLPTPRVPAEVIEGIVINKDGVNVDKEFRAGAEMALQIAIENDIDLVILQSRSPSCGSKEIYDGTFSGKRIDGQGIFAKMLVEKGFKVLDVEDL